MIPPNSTAFDVRNVGTTVEVEPNVDSDGVTVSLNIAPEIVYHAGKDVFGKWKTKETETEVAMPRFYVMKCQTNVCMIRWQIPLGGDALTKRRRGPHGHLPQSADCSSGLTSCWSESRDR